MLNRTFVGLCAFALLAAATVYAADEVKLDGVKCVVNPKAPAKAANGVEYKGAQVYFCCQNCPKAFKADTAKFAAKANHQLALTGQAKQEACPFSGEAIDADTAIKVDGASVAFCCGNCKAKAEKSDDKIALLFEDKAFDKAFKVAGEKKE